MASLEAPVNPEILAWARKNSGVPEVHAAKRANVDAERLLAWEAGTERPTIAQLRSLAELYKRPLMFFFLDERPRDFAVIKEYRRLPDLDEGAVSSTLAIATRQALERREISLQLAREAGETIPKFNLTAKRSENPSDAAARARAALRMPLNAHDAWSDEHTAIKAWRGAVESFGVLVFQVPKVSIEEMRGVSLFHDELPIILLNSSDSIRGRIFTLAHEFGHLLFRDGHLCEQRAFNGTNETEVWCNEFAGSLLVPAKALAEEFEPGPEYDRNVPDWEESRRLSEVFRVSREVIFRRLLSTGKLTQRGYQIARAKLLAAPKPPKKVSEGGPAYDLLVLWNLGAPFVRTVLGALNERRISLNEASDFLNVKARHLPNLEARIHAGFEGLGEQ